MKGIYCGGGVGGLLERMLDIQFGLEVIFISEFFLLRYFRFFLSFSFFVIRGYMFIFIFYIHPF